MKTIQAVVCGVVLAALFTLPAAAQETMRLAPGKVYVSAGFGIAFNDNVGLNDRNDERSDFLLDASLGVKYFVPFAQRHSFSLEGILVGHKGIDQSELDGFDGSLAANLDFDLDRVKLNLHESFRRAIVASGRDPLDFQEPVDDLRKYSNTTGFVANFDMGQMNAIVGYDRIIRVVEDYTYKGGSRTYDRPYLELGWRMGSSSSAFARYTYERSDSYRSTFNNSESNRFEVGVRGRMTPNLDGHLSVGYEDMSFDANGTAVTDAKDFEGLVFNGGLTHRISPLTRHGVSFSFSPENTYGTGNYYEWLVLGYQLWHQFTDRFEVNGHFTFARSEDSLYLVDPVGARGIFRSFGLAGDYRLTPAAKLFFSYDYNWQTSSAYDRNFDQHVVRTGCQWNF